MARRRSRGWWISRLEGAALALDHEDDPGKRARALSQAATAVSRLLGQDEAEARLLELEARLAEWQRAQEFGSRVTPAAANVRPDPDDAD
jgi:hypothetical protein